MVEYEMTGNKPRSMPEREHAWPIYDIFETAGGERIFIGVVTEGHWQSFCREFGLSEFLDDPALRTTTDRILARSRIIPRVAEVIKRWNAADLSATLDRLNICFSPINRPEDLFDDPHVLRPGGLVNNINADGEPFRVPALPIEWNGASIGEGLKVPVLGADTAAVRAELEARHFLQPAKPLRGSHDPRSRRLSRRAREPARGRPARRPATGEDFSLDGGEAALDPRRIRRGRAAFRGRLVPAGKNVSAIRRCARDRQDRGVSFRARTASRWR